MCLILKRLEVPEKGVVWWRDTLSEARGKRNGMRNCGKGEGNDWNVNKIKKKKKKKN